ncbi:hypothetical protein PoB_006211100 [Plakobranchus ocellatus]|uniref:Uncharacterized protein n=1 Tax=Plakobranchus ocellatus TaxID=259542 RepID=A0AAV4CUM2_9GAST|nr:hypothetical protein PoB_006211100 [Plakobranchus ocellatus]
MAAEIRNSHVMQSVVRDGPTSLPRIPRPRQAKEPSHPGNQCRRKRRVKKREFKSASVLTSGSNVTSPIGKKLWSCSLGNNESHFFSIVVINSSSFSL